MVWTMENEAQQREMKSNNIEKKKKCAENNAKPIKCSTQWKSKEKLQRRTAYGRGRKRPENYINK